MTTTRQKETVFVVLLDPRTRDQAQDTRIRIGTARIHLRNILRGITTMSGRVTFLKTLQRYGGVQEIIVHPTARGESPREVDLVDLIIDPQGEFCEGTCAIPYDELVTAKTAGLSRTEFHARHPNIERIIVSNEL